MKGTSEQVVGASTEFIVLGPLEVSRHGEVLDLGPFKQRSLLALLLMNADRVVTTDRILDELWGEGSGGKEKALWVYISHLRSVLEPERERRAVGRVIERLDFGYRLNIGTALLDSRIFDEQLRRAQTISDDPRERARELGEALDLWRGSAYEDFQYESFAAVEAERLNELRAGAFEDRVDALLEFEPGGYLVPQIENHFQRHPFRERAASQLMIALYRSGRAADALRAYSRFRRNLGEELGIEPTPELAALEERILLHDPRLQPSGDSAELLNEAGLSNPYKGLAAFQIEDSDTFFGRSRLVAEVIRKIAGGDGFVALVGASGSGKSSVVNAGVIPALGNDTIAASASWPLVALVPGSRPFSEMEAGLNRVAIEGASDLMGLLRGSSDGMVRAALRALPEGTGRLILVIDQFEELFTLASPDMRSEFLDGLCEIVEDPHERVVLIVMLRADFYDRALEHPRFADLLSKGVVNVSPLSLEELEEAVARPAQKVGVEVDSSLMAQLIVDVVGKSGALPLLQHALMELFERRDGLRMTLGSYEAMGGVGGTVASRAEDIYQEMMPTEQEATRQIFLRLVTVSTTDEWTRRRVPGSELLALDLPAVTIQSVIDAFSRHRLIAFDMDRVTRGAVVEVIHEALLTQWPRLEEWIVEAREDISVQERLSVATDEWLEAGRAEDYLFAGTRLEEYAAWADSTTLLLTTGQKAFLSEGVSRARALKELETQRSAREGRLGRRSRRRARALIVAFLIITGIAGITIVNALDRAPTIAVVYSDNETARGQAITAALETARREMDVHVITITPPFVSFESEIAEAVEGGAGLIIVDGEFEGPAFRSAARYTEQSWAVLQQTSSGGGYAVHEGGFIMGVAAAGESGASKVGFVGLHQNPESEGLRAGFEAGAREHRPSVEVLAIYATGSPWLDVEAEAAVQEAAAVLYSAGADVVFNATQTSGVVAAARQHRASTGDHVYSVGAFTDEYLDVGPSDRDFVLTSLVKRYDEMVLAIVADWMDDGALTDRLEWTLADGAMSYSASGNELAARVKRDVDALHADVVSGTVTVPEAPIGSLLPPPGSADIVDASVAFDGSTCSYDGPAEVPLGSSIAFTFENGSPGDAVLEIGDDRIVSVLAPAGSQGHGFSLMIEEHVDLACGSTKDEARIVSDARPGYLLAPEDIDVVVTILPDACAVEVRSPIVEGDLVGYLIENVAGMSGGAYSWLLVDGADLSPSSDEFRPSFTDESRRWRWEDVDESQSAVFARTLTAGKWGVGCWTTAKSKDEQVPFNRYLVGEVLKVEAG